MNDYISPVRDIFIKFLFGTEENNDLLLSFINAVLEDSDFPLITRVELKNPFNYKTFVLDKESILDVKATDEAGRIYNIEVQASDFHYFENRSLFYWSKIYSSQLNQGYQYSNLKPVICINLIDGIIFDKIDKMHTCFLLTEKSNSEYVLTDHIVMHFLEIEKIKAKNIKQHLKRWIEFFSKEGKEDMTILLKDDVLIKKAHNSYEKFTQDDQLREMYEAREKWKRDYESGLQAAEEKGLEKGIKEGIKEGIREKALEDAKKMLAEGLDVKLISRITGLSVEDIKNLKK